MLRSFIALITFFVLICVILSAELILNTEIFLRAGIFPSAELILNTEIVLSADIFPNAELITAKINLTSVFSSSSKSHLYLRELFTGKGGENKKYRKSRKKVSLHLHMSEAAIFAIQ